MNSRVCVLMERCRLAVLKLPDMGERGFEAFPRSLEGAAVLAKRYNDGTVFYKLAGDCSETIPLTAELHKHIFQDRIRPERNAVRPALSLGPMYV